MESSVNVAGTISAAEAANTRWEAIVVGTGPAGSIAARELARLGVQVLMIDKSQFPRSKVCGCCLNGSALAALDAVGLGELSKRLGAEPLSKVRLAVNGSFANLSLPSGVALSREVLDAELIRAAVSAGVHFLPGVAVRRDMASRTLRCRAEDQSSFELNCGVVVVASGLSGGSPTDVETDSTSRIGAGAVLATAPVDYQAGTIFMAVGRGGYVGLVRIEDGRLDAAAAFDSAFVKASGGLGAAAVDVLRQAGLPSVVGMETATWRGTPALTRSARRLCGDGWFAVGDAAGYVEPFTGEGMAWAIASGAAVAPIARNAIHGWSELLASEWAEVHRRLITSRQRICRGAAAVLRSPTLSRIAVSALSFAPSLASPIIHALNRPRTLG
jgi:flavin-dependent dehydrogenase